VGRAERTARHRPLRRELRTDRDHGRGRAEPAGRLHRPAVDGPCRVPRAGGVRRRPARRQGRRAVLADRDPLRLRGLYLLLSTLALHFIALYLFLKYQIHAFGPAGISYPYPSFLGFTFNDDKHWYFLLLACAVLSMLAVRNLLRSREGRAFVAIRDSDVAAGAVGVNVAIGKLKAFALSSFIVTFAGTLYAYYVTTVNQDTYSLNQVIGFYAMVIVGGLGSLSGAVYGALLYSFLPPILTQVSKDIGPNAPVVGKLLADHTSEVDLVIFGVVILVILMVRPDGLASMWRSIRGSFSRWPYTS
jgi:branched-chain amino acid transport system permease protein